MYSVYIYIYFFFLSDNLLLHFVSVSAPQSTAGADNKGEIPDRVMFTDLNS